MKKIFFCCLWSFVLVPFSAMSAGSLHYVRADAPANGDGSTWSKAYTQLPNTLVRGDTYYIGAGSYPAHTFSDSDETDKRLITIKKATATDHGTNEGWQTTYADQALWTGQVIFVRGHYVFDGVTGGGPGHWTSGFGFKFPDAPTEKLHITDELSNLTYPVDSVTIRHVEFASDVPYAPGRSRAIEATKADVSKSHIVLSYLYIHDESLPFYFIDTTGLTIEKSYITRNASGPADHSEGISCRECNNVVIRNNWWEDIEGTGVIMHMEGQVKNWDIYGNIFSASSTNTNYDGASKIIGDNTASSTIDNVNIYNNTFSGLGFSAGITFLYGSSNVRIYNNIWDCRDTLNSTERWISGLDGASRDNYFTRCVLQKDIVVGTGSSPVATSVIKTALGDSTVLVTQVNDNPFIDDAHGDFRLKFQLVKYPGGTLSAQYATDPFGSTRGKDGFWDRGAIERNDFYSSPTCVRILLTLQFGDGELPGATSTEVIKLQNFLIKQNFLKIVDPIGFFGKLTRQALMTFQRRSLGSSFVNSRTDAITRDQIRARSCGS